MNHKVAWDSLRQWITSGTKCYEKTFKLLKDSVFGEESEYKLNSFNDVLKEMDLLEKGLIGSSEPTINTDYKFDGFDWTELAECFGINVDFDEGPEDELTLENLRLYILNHSSHQVAEQIRKFLQELLVQSEQIHYYTPLWKGLLEIESDESLIKAVTCLLPIMWT